MHKVLRRLSVDEAGAEMAEWTVIAALVVVVAIAVYTGIMQGTLLDTVESIGNTVVAAVQ